MALVSALPGCTISELKDAGGPPPAEGINFNVADATYAALAEPGGMVPVDAGPLAILLIRADDTRVVALERICPHEMCDMTPFAQGGVGSWDAGTMTLWCNCHASIFDTEGKQVSGPSPRDLVAYPVTFDAETGEGVLEVGSTEGESQALAAVPVIVEVFDDELTLDLNDPAFAPLNVVGGAVAVNVSGHELAVIRRAAVGPAAFEVRDRRPAPGTKMALHVDTRPFYLSRHHIGAETLQIALATPDR